MKDRVRRRGLAALDERWSDGEAHFEAALEVDTRLEFPPWLATTRYWYGRMLLTRDEPGDRDRGRGLVAQSLAVATELGMAQLVTDAESLGQRP